MNELAEMTQSVAAKKRGVRALPDLIWAPIATGVLILIPGLIGWATGQPWLFPVWVPPRSSRLRSRNWIAKVKATLTL